MAPEQTLIAQMQATADQELDLVLKPTSHPELGDIRIEDSLFAIGRMEAPFASYARDVVAGLSRRHARIFSEGGAVYVADLDSKNGTTVNGVAVKQKPSKLRNGDELCFGQQLSYRLKISARANVPRRAARLASLTLTPEHADLGLQPIVIARFPFLISKADETFARYKDRHPHQVSYLSRRHAHIFLKGGLPFVEDLGSTNGTFIASKRLEEHAVALEDGVSIAFGGNHFAYRVGLAWEAEVDPTLTKLAEVAPSAAERGADKTTFVASADSFLDIFCVDQAAQEDDVGDKAEVEQAEASNKEAEGLRKQSRFNVFLSELKQAFSGNERPNVKRALWVGGAAVAVLLAVSLVMYFRGASERELKELLASGENARAATVAAQLLQGGSDSPEVKALATEALLKAKVPEWLSRLKSGDFDGTSAVLAGMKELGARNPDAQSLVSELEWIGDLERFVIGRGGVNAPIAIYSDEEKIKGLLKRWDEDARGHQRALARISSHVPEFKDPYAEALSHLRKLQSDDSVYLAAIERLKTAITTELNRDQPEALEAVLKEYADKYPRIGGLDRLREDLRQYMEIEREARARRLGPLVALAGKAQFSTPPFQAQFSKLAASRLPSADVIRDYQAVSKAWREGDTKAAIAALEKLATGPWASEADAQLKHKKAVREQFAELEKARGSKTYEERLLAFYESLDADEDIYFQRAIDAQLGEHRDKAIARAQEALDRAQTQWRQYRDNGSIGGAQRLESGVSEKFRAQARLLSDAHANARQGMRMLKQLKAESAAKWSKLDQEISAEAELQRRSLADLRAVLEPGVLKTKLALIGGESGEERKSP
jgi:pSer/pThr/pTyr-binding forkhead associated (FHA) protein